MHGEITGPFVTILCEHGTIQVTDHPQVYKRNRVTLLCEAVGKLSNICPSRHFAPDRATSVRSAKWLSIEQARCGVRWREGINTGLLILLRHLLTAFNSTT